MIEASCLFALGAGVVLPSCDSSHPTSPEKADSLWVSLNLNKNEFWQLSVSQSALYAASGLEGVFQQTPPLTGSWSQSGLSFPGLTTSPQTRGVYALANKSDVLLAMVGVPDDSLRGMYRKVPGESVWHKIPGVSTFALTETADRVVGISTDGIVFTEDAGVTWTTIAFGAQYFINGGGIQNTAAGLFAWTNHIDLSLSLIRSDDQGSSWQTVDTNGLNPEGAIHSLDAYTNPQEIAANVNGQIWLASSLSGGDFHRILTLGIQEGEVLINPSNPRELVVASDSLYRTSDLGLTWCSERNPTDGVVARTRLPLWNKSSIVLPVWSSTTSAGLYCLNSDSLKTRCESGGTR